VLRENRPVLHGELKEGRRVIQSLNKSERRKLKREMEERKMGKNYGSLSLSLSLSGFD
jgi:hypothetical protein